MGRRRRQKRRGWRERDVAQRMSERVGAETWELALSAVKRRHPSIREDGALHVATALVLSAESCAEHELSDEAVEQWLEDGNDPELLARRFTAGEHLRVQAQLYEDGWLTAKPSGVESRPVILLLTTPDDPGPDPSLGLNRLRRRAPGALPSRPRRR